MFILRAAEEKDLDDLYELSQLVTFINLPPDRDLIEKKVLSSLKAFQTPSQTLSKNYYLFVLEDLDKQKVVGASMIHAQHGTDEEPHFYLTVSQENKFSSTINTGFIHGTLKLGLETDGPTEIGGLILSPEYRRNDQKLGKQLSFVRFMYMALYPQHFKELIHSELMPPFDKEGRSPLWEAIGRRFMNMEYHDADVLSRSNKEFILSLFPSETIYETLLPMEARSAIGKVGEDTLPVKRMLEKIGFHYTSEVDPFDGGPHYRAKLNDIKPVQQSTKVVINLKNPEQSSLYLVMLTPKNNPHFKAALIDAQLLGEELWVESKTANSIGLKNGVKSFAMPLNEES
jgi:arginine N-succinyltransferase